MKLSLTLKKGFVGLLLLFPQIIYAQTGIIKGRAVDEHTHKSVEFASVTLLSSKDSSLVKGALTDTSGVFELNYLKEGTYILVISSIEYQKVFRGPLVVNLNQTLLDVGNLALVSDQKLLASVIVTGSKPVFERKSGSIVMNMDNKFFKTSTNALDVLKKAPGLQVKDDGSILMRNSISPKVLIDGKVVPMSAEELNAYLTNLRPDEIESIEIVTNPSAKYDAEYKGVVDIRLRRDKNLGWSGSASTTFRQNTYLSNYTNLSLTYKTHKFAYTARLGFNDIKGLYLLHGTQTIADGSILTTDIKMPTARKEYMYQFGVDYTVSKNQNIGILLKGMNSKGSQTSGTNSLVTGEVSNAVNQNIYTTDAELPTHDNYSANLNYDGKFKNSQLSVATSIANYQNRKTDNINNQDLVLHQISSGLQDNLKNDIVIKAAQIDFSTPFQKGKFEVGSKIAYTTTNNNLYYDTLAPKTGLWAYDAKRSNQFIYDENVWAGYANFSKQIKKISYQIGLRLENTDTKANSVTLNQITIRNYLKWLPSANFTYAFNDNNSLGFSLTRRLQRPTFSDLNPFQFYISPFAYAVGNPFLLPTISNVLNVAYNHKDISVSLTAGFDDNSISQVPYYNAQTNITKYFRQNLGRNNYAGMDLNYPLTVNKWWKMQHNLGLYYNEYNLVYLDMNLSAKIVSYYLNGSQIFTLPKGVLMDISYDYHSVDGDATTRSNQMYSFNMGFQKSYFQKKLNVKLNINDLFYTAVPVYHSKITGVDIITRQKYDSRWLKLQLIYNFGQSTYKAKQKQSSSAEEENRAK